MNEPFGRTGEEAGPDDPISTLRELERETSPGFGGRVRRAIYRRIAVSQYAAFSWHLPKTILVELVTMLAGILNTFNEKKGDRK